MNTLKLYKMKNIIQDYAWGSTDAIPGLLGYRNDDNIPQAELWMGSHRRGASMLVDGGDEISLADFIDGHGEEVLGAELQSRYGDLPFLFKVLAAGSPLSIQVHPDKKQAEEGFARENRDEVPLDAFNRNYKDDNHKPEIICALTEFWAMRGFRRIDGILEQFGKLNLTVFKEEIAALAADRTPEGLDIFFSSIMSLEGERKDLFIKGLTEAVRDRTDDESLWVRKLYEKYPQDAAIAAPLYLNLVRLEPGQALYLAAGELHAYLDGLGMELMASSDNVLRGGLTPKHIDRDELKRILNFSGGDPAILLPRAVAEGEFLYETPSDEFELSRIDVEEGRVYYPTDREEVQILFITEGEVAFTSASGDVLKARRGESVFVPRNSGRWEAAGQAVMYRASVPSESA